MLPSINGRFLPVESGKFLLVQSGLPGFGIRNAAQGIRNPTKDWNPESRFHGQIPESSTWNPKSTPWKPESKTVLDSLPNRTAPSATVSQAVNPPNLQLPFEILCLPKTKKGAAKRFCFKWPDTGQHTVLLDHHPPVS